MIKTRITDAGKAASGIDERNDCTVRALANVAEMSYVLAHAVCEGQGRRHGRGMTSSQVYAVFEELKEKKFLEFKYIAPKEPAKIERTVRKVFKPKWNTWIHKRVGRRVGGETAAQFLARLPKVGRFYIITTHHAFAYIDGEVYDTGEKYGSRAKMICAYECKLPQKPSITQPQINELWERMKKLEEKWATR